MQFRLIRIVAVMAILSSATIASAAAWTFNASGQNTRFSWSSDGVNPAAFGHTQGPWMGSPSVTPDGVFFSNDFAPDPMDFYVDSTIQQRAADERWVMSTIPRTAAQANQVVGGLPGSSPAGAPQFDTLHIVERGEYVSDNPTADFGGSNMSVFLFRLSPIALPLGTTFLNVTYNPDGTWIATADIDLHAFPGGVGADTLEVHLINTLTVDAGATNSSITKLSSSFFVPEPATVLVMMIVGSPLILKRRRFS